MNCTYTIYYWRTNPDRWLAENIVLGRLVYTKTQALQIMQNPTPDAATAVLQQFFTAALNILKGADSRAVEQDLRTISSWLEIHPVGVGLSDSELQESLSLEKTLQAFNQGEIGPGPCSDEPSTATPNPSATPTPTATSTPWIPPDSFFEPRPTDTPRRRTPVPGGHPTATSGPATTAPSVTQAPTEQPTSVPPTAAPSATKAPTVAPTAQPTPTTPPEPPTDTPGPVQIPQVTAGPPSTVTGLPLQLLYLRPRPLNQLVRYQAGAPEAPYAGSNPVAYDDAITTTEDSPVPVTLMATDVDGDTLTYQVVTPPANGILSGTAPDLIYSPNSNFFGTDSFTFRANDGTLDSNLATISLTITAVNDPPVAVNDAYSTNEDTPLTLAAPGVLVNDTDVDFATLTATKVSDPANGSLTLNLDGSFTYTPDANYNGSDSFTYRANDGAANSNTATVSLTVNPVNDAPVAANDAYSTNEDTPLTQAAPGVLGNDSDAEGDSFTAALVTGPSNGILTLNLDGSFSYTPDANFNGSDSFTYNASDGQATGNTVTVNLTVNAVNDPPVAVDDTYTTSEDTSLPQAATGLLGNDSDVDSAALTTALVNGPAYGNLTLNTDGSFTYAPQTNYSGSDSFTYLANDGTADSNIATVTLNITAVNDPPVAASDSYTTTEDTPLLVNPINGVLDNDSDVDSAVLTATLSTQASHGNVILNADGSFTYTPAGNYSGTDSFTYRASDGTASSNTATVNLIITAVNDPPVAGNDSYSTNEDIPLTQAAPGVLANDSDPDGNPITAVLDSNPSHGSVTLNTDGSFTYTPAANFNGPDSFTYHANDGTASSNTATVNLNITAVNDPPVANNDSYSTLEDIDLTVTAPGVLGNDTDVDSAVLTATLGTQASHGDVILNADGSFTYTPAANYNGPDSFTYHTSDRTADSNDATVSLTVTPVNDAPVASDDSPGATPVNTPITIPVTDNDSDPDGRTDLDMASVQVAQQPTHGTTFVNTNTGEVTYTPAPNYHGLDDFLYFVCDQAGLCSKNAQVVINVGGKNKPPNAQDDTATTPEDIPISVAVLANDTDPNGNGDINPATLKVTSDPLHGTAVAITTTGVISYTPALNYFGTDSLVYEVCDWAPGEDNGCGTAALTVTVSAVNDAPVAQDSFYTVAQGQVLTVTAPGILENALDVDSPTLTAISDTNPTHGALKLNLDGSFVYTPDASFVGSDSFTFHASDGLLNSLPEVAHFSVPDSQTPTLEWISPQVDGLHRYNASGEKVMLEVQASDNVAISHVRFFWWDVQKGAYADLKVVREAPYRYELDTSQLYPGDNQVFALAYDMAGNRTDWDPGNIRILIRLQKIEHLFMPFSTR